jgi:serine O-acetyltransferase
MKIIGPLPIYALSCWFWRNNMAFVSKALDFINRLLYSCWLPGSCKVGDGFVVGYWGLSIVIRKDCVIGDRVHIDQSVTLGGNGTEVSVPSIGSDVYIGAGAKLLGPIFVGDNCVIAANAVVVQNVLSGQVVAGVPAKVIKKDITLNSFLHHLKN